MEAHELTHIPYKAWCRHCVRGRGIHSPHCKIDRSGDEDSVPMIVGDYAFFTEKVEGEIVRVTILVMADFKTKAVLAVVVPHKGSGDGSVVKKVVRWLNNLGHRKIIYKSDQENAMTELWKKVKEDPSVECNEMVPEESPKGDSQSNGFAETCVREVKGMTRTLKSCLEERTGEEIKMDGEIMQWLVEYTGCLLSRYKVGPDGQTAYERIKAKKLRRPIVEFGERVLFMPNLSKGSKTGAGDHEPRYVYGVWLGIAQRSNEALIGNSTGVHGSNSVRRLSIDERWSAEALGQVKVTPWNFDAPKTQVRNEEVRNWEVACEKFQDAKVETKTRTEPLVEGTDEVMPRRAMIRKEFELRDFGYSQGCPGCEALQAGKKPRSHTEECRERIERETRKKEEVARRRVDMDRARREEDESKRTRTSSDKGDQKEVVSENRMDDEAGDIVMDDEGPSSSSSGLTDQDREWARNMAEAVVPGAQGAKRPGLNGEDPEWEESAKKRRAVAQDSDGLMSMKVVNGKVCEVYSPPRVAAQAKSHHGLRQGWSLDLTVNDEDGLPWDFNNPQKRMKAEAMLKRDRPGLLIGSPMCTAFSIIQNMNRAKMGEVRFKDVMDQAMKHLEFCCKLYKMQHSQGGYFLHEHPASASSWTKKCVMEVMTLSGVDCVTGNMCQFDMKIKKYGIEKLVKKCTRFMSNSECVLEELGLKCRGGHEHHELLGKKFTALGAIYPKKLCEAVCRGFRNQINKDEKCRGKIEGAILAMMEGGNEIDIDQILSMTKDGVKDDVKGGLLDEKMVMQARREEMKYVKKHQVYIKRPRQECYEVTGKSPIRVRWVDTNKGTKEEPNYRSRIVAMDFKTNDRPDLFSPTPAIESFRLLVSKAAHEKTSILVMDVRRAYFYAKAKQDLYIEIPEEDKLPGEENMVGKLMMSMYGTRDAARNWEEELGETMRQLGFVRGKAAPCNFWNEKLGIAAVIHGDDIVATGGNEQLMKMRQGVKKKYEIKEQWLVKEGDEIKVLNKDLTMTKEGIEVEADRRHATMIIEDMKVQKGVNTTLPKMEEKGGAVTDHKEIDMADGDIQENGKVGKIQGESFIKGEDEYDAREAATRFRANAARLNYLSQDRLDLRHASKAIARGMANPTGEDWAKMEHVAKYLLNNRRVKYVYRYEHGGDNIKSYSDSDWAGDKRDRRSTSGGVIMIGDHCIKHWSKIQGVVAQSSGEAELYAGVRAASDAIGVQTQARELGMEVAVELMMDAKAAMGMMNREGLSTTRHVEVKWFWIQEAIRQHRIRLSKVHTAENLADIGTKILEPGIMKMLCEKAGYYKYY